MIYGSLPKPIAIYFRYVQVLPANHFATFSICKSTNYFCKQL